MEALDKDPTRNVWNVLGGESKLARATQKLGRIYNWPDQVSKLATYLVYTEKRGMAPEEAWAAVNAVYPNYEEVGHAGKWLRKSPIGSPFVSFTDQTVKAAIHASRDRAGRLLALALAPHLMTLLTSLLMGLSDAEEDAIYGGKSRLDPRRWFRPLVPVPTSKGWQPLPLDLLYIFPLASEFITETGPGGFGIPFLFGQPGVSQMIDLAWNRDDMSGFNLVDRDDDALSRWGKRAAHVAEGIVPVPSVVLRAPRDAYRALAGASDQDVHLLVAKHFLGINLTGRPRKDEVERLLKRRLGEGKVQEFREILRYWNENLRGNRPPMTGEGAIRAVRRERAGR